MTSGVRPDDPTARYEPHFYGAAMLENPAPATRGVANQLKIWNVTFAENLTVKFLNGDETSQNFVKEVVKEWENVANVKFNFVDPSQDALIRVAFNQNRELMCSWALTGTDHLQVFNRQTEPTVNFTWRRVADKQKRSDVLRAFGQVLGLELEFRHPDCHPTWITDSEGNIDEAAIRTYWESELGNYITWEELKKMVLDPLEDETFFIVKTPEYDSMSVMSWVFLEKIANNLPFYEGDKDIRAELSEQDKMFIKQLYGERGSGFRPEDYPSTLDLVTFESTNDTIRFNMATTKNLRIRWGEEENEISDIKLSKSVERLDTTIHYVYENRGEVHRVVIAEAIPYGQEIPLTSTALTKLDLEDASHMKNIDIKMLNKGLEYIRIIGGESFTPQNFSFTDLPNLSKIFLVALKDSKVSILNCHKLGVVSTEKNAPWATALTPALNFNTKKLQPVGGKPQTPHSLSFLSIVSCPNIYSLALANTHLQNSIDLSHCDKLTLLYLTSEPNYIADGNSTYFRYMLSSLPDRSDKSQFYKGQVFLRQIETTEKWGSLYVPWKYGWECDRVIDACSQNKNWEFIYPDLDGYDWEFVGKPAN